MSFETAITHMAAIRSRFPDIVVLRRLALHFDPDTLYALLQASPFEPELIRHLPKRSSEGLIQRGLRIVAEGSERLQKEMAELLGEDRDLTLLWEGRRLIRALRYHRAKGFEQERRFRFVPLLGAPAIAKEWDPSLDLPRFADLLHDGGHPFAPAVDPAVLAEDPAFGERLVERYLWSELVGLVTARHRGSERFFADQADLLNLRTALVLVGAEKGDFDPDRWYVEGGGRLRRATYVAIGRGERREGLRRLAACFALPVADDEPDGAWLAREAERAMEKGQRRRGIEDPLGPNRVLAFLQEIDNRVADIRTTLIFGAAGAPSDETDSLFLGRAA